MSKSRQASKFAVLAVGTYAAAMVVGVMATPLSSTYIAQRAADYAMTARNSSEPSQQVGNYRLALALDPGNSTYRSELADTYIKQNNPSGAINALGNTVGERVRKAGYQLSLGRYEQAKRSIASLKSPEAAIIRSKIALEQGGDQKAYQAVIAARNDAERLQLGLSYASANMNDDITKIFPLMGEGESKRRLQRAQSGGVALAQELYKERLYRSAERILAKAGESGAKYLLLAHVQMNLPENDDQVKLEAAKNSLKQGIKRDPANLTLRLLLVEIYHRLEDENGATRENQVIQRLKTGKL
ncbi:MAG TPA: hypothetical protein VF272_01355 [Candidatus Saccharimonadia bacterium]